MNYKKLSDGFGEYGEKVAELIGTLIMAIIGLVIYVGIPLGILYVIAALILFPFGIEL